MTTFSTPETKQCFTCKQYFPNTKEFFYTNKLLPDGSFILKGQCKTCVIAARKKLRERDRDAGPQANSDVSFTWNKLTQSRFKAIAKVVQQHSLTPENVLSLNRTKAAQFSYNLGARLKAVKYAIRDKHPEAMHVLFGWEIDDSIVVDTLEEEAATLENKLVAAAEPPILTLKIAAERILEFETRLECALTDVEEARRMLADAEAEATKVKAERREALRFMLDMAKELTDEG